MLYKGLMTGRASTHAFGWWIRSGVAEQPGPPVAGLLGAWTVPVGHNPSPRLPGAQVDHHDKTHDKLLRFNNAWDTELANDSLLIYSSGRSPHLYEKLAVRVVVFRMQGSRGRLGRWVSVPLPSGIRARARVCLTTTVTDCGRGSRQAEVPLLKPDILVCSVGTEIFFEGAGRGSCFFG